jgi:hypothetical protein
MNEMEMKKQKINPAALLNDINRKSIPSTFEEIKKYNISYYG